MLRQTLFYRLLGAAVFAIAATASLPAKSNGIDPLAADPVALYGRLADYDIMRDGTKVGEHRISFQRAGDSLVVESRSEIQVPFLFITAYRFNYRARTVWHGGTMVELDAYTDDDGKETAIKVRRQGSNYIVEGPNGRYSLSTFLPPTEHWAQSFLSDSLLNTITGEINKVSTTPLSPAYVPAASGVLRADRFRLDGDLRIETWYEPSGRWAGMRFEARDGSTIEYRCRTCTARLAGAEP